LLIVAKLADTKQFCIVNAHGICYSKDAWQMAPYDARVGKSEPRKLEVTWKVTPLTAANDLDGSLRERQLQVICGLLIRASEEAKAENLPRASMRYNVALWLQKSHSVSCETTPPACCAASKQASTCV
jgi:hypothetical protein